MAIDDWKQYTQSVLFSLIVSFLLAKLFSVIFTFRDENIRITRANPNEHQHYGIPSEPRRKSAEEDTNSDAEFPEEHISSSEAEEESAGTSTDSEDDWEGVEITELDEAFGAATAFVAETAVDRSSEKVSNDLKLQLYGLYKIATQGACSVPHPSVIKMIARAKWNAWHKLGAMSREEAMHKYIQIVTESYPTLSDASTSKRRGEDSNEQSSKDATPLGPVFSTSIHEESANELKSEADHIFAKEGDMENLLKCVEGGVSVDIKDSEGQAPLNCAVDRSHLDVAELLLKDNECQTPLQDAAGCESETIAELIVKRNDGTKDDDDSG